MGAFRQLHRVPRRRDPAADEAITVSSSSPPTFPLPHWHAGFDQQLDVDGTDELHFHESALQPLLWERKIYCYACKTR